MLRPTTALAASMMTCLCLGAAHADTNGLVEWDMSGEWDILIDPETGNGCLMQKAFDDGTIVQFGAEPARKGGYFAAYNIGWTEIKDGETGQVVFTFEDAAFGGEAVGRVVGLLHGAKAFFNNPNLPMEFARKRMMTVTGSRGNEITIDLSGTSAAIKAVQACQKEQVVPE
jgi:hypothetical protein